MSFKSWLVIFSVFTFLPHILNAQGGLVAEYFNDTELKNVFLTRVESKPYLNYFKERPAPGVNAEYFSARWTSILTPPTSGEFTFSVRADDGVRLWIDDTKIIDAWIEQEAATYKGSISLEKGRKYKLKIEYYNSWLHSVLMLSWETPDDGYSLFGYRFFRTLKEVPSSVFTVDTPQPAVKKEADAVPVQNVNTKPATKSPSIAPQPDRDKRPEKLAARQVSDSLQNSKEGKVIAVNEFIRLKSVRFVLSKPELLEGSFQELDTIAEYLKRRPNLKIKIVGHADYEGNWTANHTLSQQRANAVADYLKGKGIVEQRITVEAKGASQPIVRDADPQNREENRRVEFMLIPN